MRFFSKVVAIENTRIDVDTIQKAAWMVMDEAIIARMGIGKSSIKFILFCTVQSIVSRLLSKIRLFHVVSIGHFEITISGS